jgi:NTE family protein
MSQASKPVIALVLGGGAARGWAHIGVIHELAEMGIEPDIVVGTSVGSVVGGAYASGNLQPFEDWISSLRRVDIIRLLDAKMTGGGFLQGKSLMGAIEKRIGDPNIEDLEVPFACVATELDTGREVWLREGSLLDACRASIALPGMFAPSRLKKDKLLVDGGLVNPVPVSLARAMGGEAVIAVNLNGDLIGRHFFIHPGVEEVSDEDSERALAEIEEKDSMIAKWAAKMKAGFAGPVRRHCGFHRHHAGPHYAIAHGRRTAGHSYHAAAEPRRPDGLRPFRGKHRGGPRGDPAGGAGDRKTGPGAGAMISAKRNPRSRRGSPEAFEPGISRRVR